MCGGRRGRAGCRTCRTRPRGARPASTPRAGPSPPGRRPPVPPVRSPRRAPGGTRAAAAPPSRRPRPRPGRGVRRSRPTPGPPCPASPAGCGRRRPHRRIPDHNLHRVVEAQASQTRTGHEHRPLGGRRRGGDGDAGERDLSRVVFPHGQAPPRLVGRQRRSAFDPEEGHHPTLELWGARAVAGWRACCWPHSPGSRGRSPRRRRARARQRCWRSSSGARGPTTYRS